MTELKRGDILLYYDFEQNELGKLIKGVIKFGERLEDPNQSRYYYHTAIVLDPETKFEADGLKVTKHPIEPYDKDKELYDVFRPYIDPLIIENALQYILNFDGQLYDWFLILDDALRYSSGLELHLPSKFINFTEKHMKICSSLIEFYLIQGKFIDKPKNYCSPEDVFIDIKESKVV